MRQSKIEFYPDGFDEKGKPKGPRTMVLDFRIPNSKRWRMMVKEDKLAAWGLICDFINRLEEIKQELRPECYQMTQSS